MDVYSTKKMTGETPEVRSDKRKPREKKEREKRENERKREKKREKERKNVKGQSFSICIQFAKRKIKYIRRNA